MACGMWHAACGMRHAACALALYCVHSLNRKPLGYWVFLKFSFSVISNHRIFCWAEVGKTKTQNPGKPTVFLVAVCITE